MRAWVRLGMMLAMTAAAIPATASATPNAATVAKRLGRGVNILGYDPIWSDPKRARFKASDFAVIRKGGFDTVRVVLQAFAHMDAQNRLNPQWLTTLDMVVREARRAGLNVILDEHDFNPCSDDPVACRPKLIAFWEQIATRYAGQPDTVLFELLNEPHGKLNGEAWNVLAADVLAVVRRTNPTRTVIIGPTGWNSRNDLPQLKLPAGDRNIIVTFHYYDPFPFTHQGAPWAESEKDKSGVTWGSPADHDRLAADFDAVAAWANANDRPVLLGEFGAFDKSGTPVALRAAYTAAVARAAEARHLPWAYWQFDSDFIVYDIDRAQWVLPIKDALRPPAKKR